MIHGASTENHTSFPVEDDGKPDLEALTWLSRHRVFVCGLYRQRRAYSYSYLQDSVNLDILEGIFGGRRAEFCGEKGAETL